MPKLTINSVCTKGSLYPMICNFQNGYPSEDFECKCAVIQDNNGKKTIAAEFGRILYVGAEDNENIGQTLLLLRNRKTGKVRLIETGNVELTPIIDLNHDQEETLQHQQQSNIIVKPVQHEETSTHTGVIGCDIISNTSSSLNSSISRHRCNSTPSKKGSTTSFSRTHSGQFQHLHNFLVDEIKTIPNHLSETECNKSPEAMKVIETNKMEQFTVDIGDKELNEANKMTRSNELPINMLEKKETALENAAIASENSIFTIYVSTEELEDENKIIANEEPLENFLEEKGTDLEAEEIDSTIDIRELLNFSSDSVDTSSEFENENNLKIKMDQEKHEENRDMKHKNCTLNQYCVAALGLDSKGEKKMKRNADSSKSNDNLTSARTTNDSISSNHTENIYICDYCQAVFENKGLMIFHLNSHEFVMDTNIDVIQSDIRTDRNSNLNENFNEFNDSESSRRKNKVDTTIDIRSVNNNQNVTENTSSDHMYICDFCEAVFKNKGTLISHVISHEIVNNTSNDVTRVQYNRIIRNENEHEITDLNLNEKSNDLKDGKNKKRKKKTITENTAFENTYICDYCEAVFENKSALIFHLISHKSVNDTSNDVTYAQNNRIIRINNEHELSDLNDKSNELKDGTNKKRKKKTITENTAFENTYICDYCEAVFENKSALIFHLISHKSVNDTSNDVTYAQNNRIIRNDNEHEKTDLNEKSNELKDGKPKKRKKKTFTENTAFDNTFICDYCEAVFENKSALISHVISHKSVNDTSNDVTYAQNNRIIRNYNEHEITDLKEKSYELKDGKDKERKKKTIIENTAFKNTYICDYCEATFENKGALIFHLISHAFVKHIDNGTRSRIKRTITIANNNERNSDCKKKSNECKDGDKTTNSNTGDTVTKNVFAHNRTVTDNISPDNTYICGYCEAKFEEKGTFISHITSHEKHICNNTPEQESKTIINIDNYENKNDCSIIKDTDNENLPLLETKTTIAIDGDNNENENAYSKNYRNKIDENRNPELNATENNYICDYCEAVFDDKEPLVLHLISHKFIKDVDNITLTKIKDIKVTGNENNENVNPSENMKKKDVNPDFTETSKTVKGKTRKRNNQVREQTARENTYVCDYCNVEFEGKKPLILHITSHKFAKDTDNVIQTEITTIQGNNDENQENENNNACSKNYGNTKKQKKRNPEKSKKFKDGLNKKKKFRLRIKIKLVKTDQGKQIENGETEIENDIATKLINCKHCTYETDNTSDILKHILTHTQANSIQRERIYICNDCGREFKSKASLIIHIESHKNNSNRNLRIRRHVCVTCNSSFTTRANLINHQTKLHPSTKPYKCTMCDNKYITKQGLTVHIQTHKIKPFRCTICKYQCNKINFVKHMKSHNDSKPFECELCDFKFDKLSGLKQHMVTHTGKKEHKCTICDSKFSLLNGLNRHLLIHSKYKPFKCAICGAGFKDNSSLKRHRKIHTGEKSYKCTYCEYSSISGYDLKRHMKIHNTKLTRKGNAKRSNSETFQCTMCDSKFSLKNSLICHMKIHTSEKIHKCTFCDKEFIHFSGLKRHLNVHSKNKPVKCTTCNTSYDNETALKWHLRRNKKHQ